MMDTIIRRIAPPITVLSVAVGIAACTSQNPAPHGQAPPRSAQRSTVGCAGLPAASGRPPTFTAGSRKWPDCTDTGVPAGLTLKKITSPAPTGDGTSAVTNIHQDGLVINGVDLMGSIDVWASNVTIENSRIQAESWWGINLRAGYKNLKILHCTIVGLPGRGPDNGAEDYGVSSSGGAVEVGWSDISEFGEGISLGTGNIHDSYVHDLQSFVPAGATSYEHLDDLISDGGSGLSIRHNTMLDSYTTQKGASASIGLFDDSEAVTHVKVTDNFIAGGAYALYSGGKSSRDIVVAHNVFSTMYWPGGGYYGPDDASFWHGGSGNQWSGNTWADGPRAGRRVGP